MEYDIDEGFNASERIENKWRLLVCRKHVCVAAEASLRLTLVTKVIVYQNSRLNADNTTELQLNEV